MRTNTIDPMEAADVRNNDPDVVTSEQEVPSIDVLFSRYADFVARWAARLGGPRLDVDDIVQDVFLVAQRRLAEFRGDCRPTTWLYRITERVVWNRLRRERVRRFWLGTRSDFDAIASSHRTPIEELQSKQATALFYRMLDRLSERSRSVIVLFELEGVSGQEIAELKGVPVGTIWVWLHRARAQLAAEMKRIEGSTP